MFEKRVFIDDYTCYDVHGYAVLFTGKATIIGFAFLPATSRHACCQKMLCREGSHVMSRFYACCRALMRHGASSAACAACYIRRCAPLAR